jgi:EmrB/QacA subfamily drug resistance transporter
MAGLRSVRERMRDPRVIYERRWLALLVLCVSLMVIGIDNTILNVALPTLAKSTSAGGVGASASDLQWIVDSYTLVFAGLLLTAGSLGDKFGRYRFLAVGLSIFGIGSGLSAFASSSTVLIGTRALMGIGASFIMPSTLSLLTNLFHDPRERAKAIGIWAGVSAVGIAAGPLAGGVLLEHFWWGSVFIVNIPVVVLGLVLGFFLVPESRDPASNRLDPLGSVLSIAGLGSLLWAVIEGPSHGWTSGSVLAGFLGGVVFLGAFMAWELHTPEPMLNVRFFENPRFSAASGAITITFLTLFGTIFLLTQYLQSVLGYSTIKAGAVFVPQAAMMMVFAPLSSRWVRRFGNKAVVVTGMVIATVVLVYMTTLDANSSVFEVILVGMGLGLGVAHIMPPATESIMGALPREKAGVGSAMNDTTRQVGGAVGVALLGSLLSSRYSSRISSSLSGQVPPTVLTQARDSVGSALDVARGDGAPFASQIVDASHRAFVSGMHVAVVVAAAIMAVAALGVLRWLPARGTDHGGDTAARPENVAALGLGPVDATPAAPDAVIADERALADELAAVEALDAAERLAAGRDHPT